MADEYTSIGLSNKDMDKIEKLRSDISNFNHENHAFVLNVSEATDCQVQGESVKSTRYHHVFFDIYSQRKTQRTD